MMKKIWNNIEIILITLSMLLAMFTVGLIVGVYISSDNIEKLSTENIRQYQTIQQQKERIRELQKANDLLGEIKEIDFYLRVVDDAIGNIRISINNRVIFFNSKYKV